MGMQSLIRLLYPPQCVMCEAQTDADFAFCGACWAGTPFIEGLCCDACGSPLPGDADDTRDLLCDDCLVTARPWSAGRAVMIYKDAARGFILRLKHADRTELARAAGPWLARTAKPLLTDVTVVVPVPLHRLRLLKRRYNQSALLARQMADVAGVPCHPDALIRVRRTAPLDGHTRDARFAALDRAIQPNPKVALALKDRDVLLIDDVMTSGATFAAATEACHAAGARSVRVLALARVVKDA